MMKNMATAWISDSKFQINLFTDDFLSGISGLEVGSLLDKSIQEKPHNELYVSLKGVDSISPSFINGAFIYLIDLYGEDYFRKYIKVVEAKASLVQIIGNQLKDYIVQRNNFIQNFATHKIYCGIDNSSEGIKLRYHLYKLIDDKSRFLFNTKDGFFSKKTELNISTSSSFIGILTTNETHLQENLLTEANFAIKHNKPTLFIVKKGIQLHVPAAIRDFVQIVYFDNENQWQLLRNVNEIILKNQVKRESFGEVLAWGALGIGALALIALLPKK